MPLTPTAHNIASNYFESKENMIKWKCDICLATIPVAEWGDIHKLIDTKVTGFKEKEGKLALNHFTQSFNKIAENSEYAALQEKEKLEQEKQLNDIKLSRLTEAGMKRKIDDLLVAEKPCTSNSNNIVPETILNNNNNNYNNNLDETQSVSVQLKNDGIKLHHRYVRGEKMFSDELKRMSFGLSSILDLVDCCPEDQRSVIGEEIWNQLCDKYYNKYQIRPDSLQPKIEETLIIVEKMCKANKNNEARTYIDNVIKRYPDLKRSLKAIDFVLEVFEEQTYLFDPIVAKTLSENDYVTSAWLPLLKKCLYINENTVRALVGETSNSYTTSKKTDMYGSKTVGFKIDIRFVTSINDKVFDVGAAEAAKLDPMTDKIIEDEGKLLREGKDIVDKSLLTVLLEKSTPHVTGWVIQLSGLTGHIYSIHLAKPGLYVAIPQSAIHFPSKASPSTFSNTFKFLLYMCQSMNDLALEARDAISFFSLDKDSISNNLHMRRCRNSSKDLLSWIRPSYYTPPSHDCTQSVIPSYLPNNDFNASLDIFKEYVQYESDDEEKEKTTENAAIDVTGWTRLESGIFYNIYSNTYSECNPL
ncbi:hypothetical protein MFLAVUS_005049 [Mucor flavus]|uniref:Uncharacterized protein n=1 Tax=Mucor flavus TaxID=439312 RepID=A0ABP9YXQ2_9FUNG